MPDIFGVPATEFLLDKHLADTLVILGAAGAATIGAARWIFLTLRDRRVSVGVREKLVVATDTYVVPHYCRTDPAHFDEPHQIRARHRNVVRFIERSFRSNSGITRIVVLADAGMGKSALLLNLYNRYLKRLFRKTRMELIDMGSADAREQVTALPHPADTILLLDGFDEHRAAVDNYEAAFRDWVQLTEPFFRVVITCRTQFFAQGAELPAATSFVGGAMPAGPGIGRFRKIYLAPLSDWQIDLYLARRFLIRLSGFSVRRWRQAREVTKRAPSLSVRPMLLAYIEFLLAVNLKLDYPFQVYQAMVLGWISRIKSDDLDPDPVKNLFLVYLLALDMAINHGKRGAPFITQHEAVALAEGYSGSSQICVGKNHRLITLRALFS